MLRIATKQVVRTPGGRYITRKLMESDPETLARAKPDEIWMAEGERPIVVADMELRHMMNVIRILEKRASDVMKEFGIKGNVSQFAGQLDRRYITMCEELRRRADCAGGANTTPEEVPETTPRKFTE